MLKFGLKQTIIIIPDRYTNINDSMLGIGIMNVVYATHSVHYISRIFAPNLRYHGIQVCISLVIELRTSNYTNYVVAKP